MQRRILIVTLSVTALVLASLVLAYPYLESPYEQGIAEAERDLRAGKLAVMVWPTKGGGFGIADDHRDRDRLKVVEMRVGTGCVIDDHDLLDRLEGYNSVMLPEIERRAKMLPAEK